MTSARAAARTHPSARPPLQRLRRSLAMAAIAVGAAAALSGCFKVDMTMELQSDDTVDGSVILAVAKEQAELLGGEDAVRESLQGENGGIFSDAPEEGTFDQRDYEDDKWIGTEATFADVPIDEFGGSESGEELSITRDGDEFVVEGSLPASNEIQDEASQALLDSAEFQITVVFPGDVSEANGTVDGNQVTWEPTPGEALTLTARGSAESGTDWMLIGAIVALVALVVIGVGLLIVVRGRQAAPAPAGGEPTGAPMGEPTGDSSAAMTAELPEQTPTQPPTGPPPENPPAP